MTPGGDVATLAGLPGVSGYRNGTLTDAWFNQPRALALDASGNLYVADTGNAAIRKITTAGAVSTLTLTAGTTTTGGGTTDTGSGTTGTGGTTTSSSSSGGGGGEAVSGEFYAALGGLMLLRWWSRRKRAD